MNLNELRRERARLINDARALHEAADAETREMTAEENEQFDRLMDTADEKRAEIERRERLLDAQADLGESRRQTSMDDENVSGAGENGGDDEPAAPVFESRGMAQLPAGWQEQRAYADLVATLKPAYQRAFGAWLRTGLWDERALQVDVATSGGYLVPPMQFVDMLIKDMDNMAFIRQWATTFTVATAQSMGAPSLAADPADPIWTSEIGTGDEDSTMSFGRRDLYPHPLAKRIKVSKKLLRMVDAEALVRDRLAYKFGVTMENNFLNGNGSNQPLGVFTASADGIPTSRDVSTGNTTTAIGADNLFEVKYSLKGQYWRMARWLFHRDAIKAVAKLKDGEGQYLWQESMRAGEPDMLLGFPTAMSEYAPNTFTTGLYVGILGDFSQYWIVDALDMQVQRLVELYAETNQDGFIGRMESDGAPVVAEAFARVTLA